MEKISVIIPVYNAEKTISKCLDSIMASEYEEYEVILIDDGSTDNSMSIISEYANKDSRIKIFTQPNSGPSTARNKGLTLADGEIIAFVDSDDYVRNDYLDQLAKAFNEQKADAVFFEFHRVTPDGTELSVHNLPELQADFYQNLIILSESDMFGYTWIKAFRKKISCEIRFDKDVNLFEDELFTCKLLEKPVNLYFLKEAIYYYVRADGTLAQRTHGDYCKLCDKVFQAWKKLLNQLPENKVLLEHKANHMAEVCKYYGLEKNVNIFSFYQNLRDSDFIKYCTLEDPLLTAIIKKRWCKVAWIYFKYNTKVILAKYIVRKYKI